MVKRAVLIIAFVVILILTVGCGTLEPTPRAVLHPTNTFSPPTDTPTLPPTRLAPTDTPQPSTATATPVPTAESSLGGVRVTFVNNAGFLITAGDKKVLIDALYEGHPEGILKPVVDAQPPFDAIDLILATHEHEDHFSPELVARAMSQNPEAVFVSSQRAVDWLLAADDGLRDRAIPIQLQAGESEQLDVNGIVLEAVYISHDVPDLLNLGFVITVGDVGFFHTGDSSPEDITVSYLQSYGLPEKQLDVAFVPYFYLTREEYHAYALEGIQARYVIPMHYDYQRPPSGIEADFPNAIVFHDTLESWLLPVAASAMAVPPRNASLGDT
jgi:L-ascorbate metabolism protein UlaG (beta-lactamase superfamily)